MDETLLDKCRHEILELHQFFEAWVGGRVEPDPQIMERLKTVLADGFEMVPPDGRVVDRDSLLERLSAAHGAHADEEPPLRIWIEQISGRLLDDDLALVRYEEWQEIRGEASSRQSTALMRRQADTPEGVEWLHVQETWLIRPS